LTCSWGITLIQGRDKFLGYVEAPTPISAAFVDMDDEKRLRRALFAHIEQKTVELWTSIDDLQKALEAVPTPERAGDEDLSKRFIELMKNLEDLGRRFQSGLAAIDESSLSTKH
jgi:hypothetical protein